MSARTVQPVSSTTAGRLVLPCDAPTRLSVADPGIDVPDSALSACNFQTSLTVY